MKSLGNLPDFVRSHMLEPFDVAPRIRALIGHFDDLNRAHEAVLKAKRKAELLTPLVADGDGHAALTEQIDALRACRDALKPYVAGLKLPLLEKRIRGLADEWTRQDSQVKRLGEMRDELRATQDELKRSIADNGGDRLERLAAEIRKKDQERQARERKAERYGELLRLVDELPATDEPGFFEQRQRLAAITETAQRHDATLENELAEHGVDLRQGKQEHDALSGEITSLKARRSNIPAEQIGMRSAMCQALNLPEAEMPFAGELLQVLDGEGAHPSSVTTLP